MLNTFKNKITQRFFSEGILFSPRKCPDKENVVFRRFVFATISRKLDIKYQFIRELPTDRRHIKVPQKRY